MIRLTSMALMCLTMVSCCTSSLVAQVKLTQEPVTIFTGFKSPRLVGDSIVAEPGSVPRQSSAVFVHLAKQDADRVLWIDFERLPDLDTIDPAKIDENTWTLTTPGRYRVTVVATADGEFYRDRITVNVTGSIIDPGNPTDPPLPPPSGDWSDLRDTSRSTSASVNDPDTARALSQLIRDAVPKISPLADMAAAQSIGSGSIEQALSQRKGESLKKDWVGLWRKPVNQKINEAAAAGRIPTPREYAAALLAVADGLVSP